MARPRGRPFEKGNTFSKGGKPLPEDIKTARKLNKIAFERLANKIIHMTEDELRALATDPQTPMIDKAVGSILARSIADGDDKRLDFFLNRLLGKVSDKVEHSFPKRTLITRPSGEVVELGTTRDEEDE